MQSGSLGLDLSSDHSPIIVTLSSQVIQKQMPTPLCNKNTDWEYFKEQLESKLSPNIRIKTKEDLNTAIEFLTTSIQDAAWDATPTKSTIHKFPDCPISVKKAIAEKRKTRKKWQLTRDPKIKT